MDSNDSDVDVTTVVGSIGGLPAEADWSRSDKCMVAARIQGMGTSEREWTELRVDDADDRKLIDRFEEGR